MILYAYVLLVLLILPVSAVYAIEDELNIFVENDQYIAQAMVEEAMLEFGAGIEDAIYAMNDPDNLLFRDGNVYVFLVDSNGTFLAHAARADLVGTSMYDSMDAEGFNLGELFESVGTPHGEWALYTDTYPDSGYKGDVKVWLKTGWGHMFGAAIYVDASPMTEIYLTERDRERQEMAQSMVEEAKLAFSKNAYVATSKIQDPGNALFHDEELYVTVVHRNGTIVADGNMPELTGTDIETLEDTMGANLEDIYETNVSAYGRWVDYHWPDPRFPYDGGKQKLSWVITSGDHRFGVGIYPEDPNTDTKDALSHHDASRKAVAKEMMEVTKQAFALDPEGTISLIHKDSLLFHDAEIYPIIANQNGVVVAHGKQPAAVGIHISDMEVGDGVTLEYVFGSGSPHGDWVEHEGIHPISGANTLQKTLVTYSGGYTFAVGTYPQYQIDLYPDLTQQDLERMSTAQRMVVVAAQAYNVDPQATISEVHNTSEGLFRDKELFVIIINFNGTIMAHGYNSNIAGIDKEFLSDTRGVNIGELIEENLSVYGRWIEYYWPNSDPNESNGDHMLSWYRAYGDHIFAVGTYPESLN